MRLALLLLSAFQIFILSAFAQPAPYPPSAEIQAIVNQISADTLRATIQGLTEFHTRHTYSDTTSDSVGVGAALRWVEAKAAGYGPARFAFERFPYVQTWGGQQVTRHDLICHVGGDSIRYLIGGHLDSRAANLSDVTGFAPGGDDNGSSCAAFLEMLRLLPDSLAHRLDVIWFTGEEEGLWGSAALAQHMHSQNARVDGMICMDMIGHIALSNGAVDSVSVRLYADGANDQGGPSSASRNFQRYTRWVGEAYVPNFEMRLFPAADRPGRGSDHLSFSDAGYAALRVIERNEDLAYQHGPNDVVTNLSPTYARKIAMVTYGALLTMLKAPPRPAPPVVSWLNPHLLHGVIPDSVVLPDGGHFFVSFRNYLSTNFDSIVDLGTARSFDFTAPNTTDIYCFSVSRSNAEGYPSPFSTEIQSVTAEAREHHAVQPNDIALQAFPNPFNQSVVIEYTLPQTTRVRLAIYDISGRRVAMLLDQTASGTGHVVWSPQNTSSGLYLVRLSTEHTSLTRKLLYLR